MNPIDKLPAGDFLPVHLHRILLNLQNNFPCDSLFLWQVLQIWSSIINQGYRQGALHMEALAALSHRSPQYSEVLCPRFVSVVRQFVSILRFLPVPLVEGAMLVVLHLRALVDASVTRQRALVPLHHFHCKADALPCRYLLAFGTFLM